MRFRWSPVLRQMGSLRRWSSIEARFLAIETSCDDTSVAMVTSQRRVLALCTHHQTKQHELTGGIVPVLAAEAHRERLPALLAQVLKQSATAPEQIEAIAVTQGPGLPPCLKVGVTVAKSLAAVLNKPLFGVHHMEAHALTPRLTESTPPSFPYLSLLVSGGHTLLVLTNYIGNHQVLGSTLDDAAGEAFDKVARYLEFPWLDKGGGAGASVEEHAANATSQVRLPVPFEGGRFCAARSLDFSFSGLKTEVLRTPAHTYAQRCDLAAAFQTAVGAHLRDRVQRALRRFPDVTCVVMAGGVAANRALQAAVRSAIGTRRLVVPPATLCTDNAAMIAWAAIERWAFGMAPECGEIRPKWSLDELQPHATRESSALLGK